MATFDLKSLKIPLRDIRKAGVNYNRFDNSRNRADNLSFVNSLFMRSFYISVKNDDKLKDIKIEPTKSFNKIAFNTISKNVFISENGKEKKKNGPKLKGENAKIHDMLSDYYDKHFSKQFKDSEKDNKIDSTNLSFIIAELCTEMETAFSNNIRMNCTKQIHQFINEFFCERKVVRLTTDKFKKLSIADRMKYTKDISDENKKIKEIKQELRQVKEDVIENTLKCDEKYHQFVKNLKEKLPKLPKNVSSYATYIDLQPFDFFTFLIEMNGCLNKIRQNYFNRYH